MGDALEARSQRLCHHLQRPLAGHRNLLNENAGNALRARKEIRWADCGVPAWVSVKFHSPWNSWRSSGKASTSTLVCLIPMGYSPVSRTHCTVSPVLVVVEAISSRMTWCVFSADQQLIDVGISGFATGFRPAKQRRHDERQRFVVGSDRHPDGVGRDIIDAIGDGFAEVLVDEIGRRDPHVGGPR